MLTHAHLDLWQAYGGDIDGWVRQGRRGNMSADDWALIDSLCQALHLVEHGLAAPALAADTERRLLAASADPTVHQRLRGLAATMATR